MLLIHALWNNYAYIMVLVWYKMIHKLAESKKVKILILEIRHVVGFCCCWLLTYGPSESIFSFEPPTKLEMDLDWPVMSIPFRYLKSYQNVHCIITLTWKKIRDLWMKNSIIMYRLAFSYFWTTVIYKSPLL